jgi:hypothetical protein
MRGEPIAETQETLIRPSGTFSRSTREKVLDAHHSREHLPEESKESEEPEEPRTRYFVIFAFSTRTG